MYLSIIDIFFTICYNHGMGEYYDGTKLLSLKDKFGKDPDIYLSTSNRSAGKTTYFSRFFVNRFIRYGEKFALFYRYNYELSDVSEKFFKEIRQLFFPSYAMTSKSKARGIYHELYLNGKPCGYAISINSAEALKKYSHLFADVQRVLFDEFQSENNKYVPGEIKKFLSVMVSISRGAGKQVRRVPVYMLANYVSILNPYYIALGISDSLTDSTVYLRGDGFVLEQGFYEGVAELQKESGLLRAFKNDDYTKYTTERIYLNDNAVFIDKPAGKNNYLATVVIEGTAYALREYPDAGVIFCDMNIDTTFPKKITLSADDMNVNYLMISRNDFFLSIMRKYFEHGCFRFKNLQCKKAVFKMLSY